jgi:hypothetical protein
VAGAAERHAPPGGLNVAAIGLHDFHKLSPMSVGPVISWRWPGGFLVRHYFVMIGELPVASCQLPVARLRKSTT